MKFRVYEKGSDLWWTQLGRDIRREAYTFDTNNSIDMRYAKSGFNRKACRVKIVNEH